MSAKTFWRRRVQQECGWPFGAWTTLALVTVAPIALCYAIWGFFYLLIALGDLI